MTDNQRPGVYSSYTVRGGYTAPQSAKQAALVCAVREELLRQGEVILLSGMHQAQERLDAQLDAVPLECCRILFESGVSGVAFAGVQGDYAPVLAAVEQLDSIGAVICDAAGEEALAAALESVCASAANARERLLFVGAEDTAQALGFAGQLNHERAVVCAPAAAGFTGEYNRMYGACALAGAVLAANDAVYNFSGCVLEPLREVEHFTEREIQQMLSGGVSVLEQSGGAVRCIRALTSRTQSGGVPDLSMRSLNTVLIIDAVMQGIRDCLRQRLAGAQALSHQSVATQVTVQLADFKDRGLIESFSSPAVSADGADPSVCVVELAFKAAHMVSQIYITAHIAL